MSHAFDAYCHSLTSARNLRLAAPAYQVRQAEKALAAIKANPDHTCAQASDAKLALAEARLALWRAERGVGTDVFPDYETRCAMYK